MTKSMSCFTTPFAYKPKGNIGDVKLKGCIDKKEIFSQPSHTDNSPSGEHKGLFDGIISIDGEHKGLFDGDKSHGGEHKGLFGGIISIGGEHSGFFDGGKSHGSQPVGNQVINGTACNDTLRGNNSGRDTLVGTTEIARGFGEHDILIGGNARDTFVLGDTQGSFYLGKGNADYAEIHNFGRCNDLIQLAGSAQDYSISYAGGISSVYRKDGCGSSDLVAQIDSACSPLDLNANYFQYVNQSAGTPVFMG
jgi:hypothetical protein